MSLRRKSCDACYKSRRKCSLDYPTCDTCRRTNKTCRYVYMPMILERRDTSAAHGEQWTADRAFGGPTASNDSTILTANTTDDDSALFLPDSNDISQHSLANLEAISSSSSAYAVGNISGLLPVTISQQPSPATLLGPLGEIQDIEGSSHTWQWVIEEVKTYPASFAQRGENTFIHSELYREYMPQSVQTAFSICSGSCMINDRNRGLFFRVLNTQVLSLLASSGEARLIDELAKVQALLLYQIIRLFQGDIEQRSLAEQQQEVLMTWAVKLAGRTRIELQFGELAEWQTWILAESARRTALMVYMVYGLNSMFREGICIGFPTLAKLPTSTSHVAWDSEEYHRQFRGQGHVVTYEEFTSLWLVSTSRRLGSFEKLIVGACRGIDTVMGQTEA